MFHFEAHTLDCAIEGYNASQWGEVLEKNTGV